MLLTRLYTFRIPMSTRRTKSFVPPASRNTDRRTIPGRALGEHQGPLCPAGSNNDIVCAKIGV